MSGPWLVALFAACLLGRAQSEAATNAFIPAADVSGAKLIPSFLQEPILRITSGRFSSPGNFQLQVSSGNAFYQVLASTNLVNWSPLGAQPAADDRAVFQDIGAAQFRLRFYRLRLATAGLSLSKTNVNPLEMLSLGGAGAHFDPNASTWVHFQDSAGFEIKVRSYAVATNRVDVAIPSLLALDRSNLGGGQASVSVSQVAGMVTNRFESSSYLRIADLPQLELSPGAVTLEYLHQLTNALAIASRQWQTIETASLGRVDTSLLRLNLLALQTNLVNAQKDILQVVSQPELRISLGRMANREVVFNRDALLLLDRMIAASFLNHRLADPASLKLRMATFARLSTDPLECSDVLACMRDEFNGGAGQSAQSTFQMFDKWNTIGGAGAGILAATAVALGLASAPVAATLAGTAGAVLFFSTYVAPAVMGASALSFAAPFIEAQTGNPVSLNDYRPALDHIRKGSEAYLVDEVQGRLLEGVLKPAGASEDLLARTSLFVGASKSVLGLLDLSKPNSVAAQSFSNSETIFAHLVPEAGGEATYAGQLSSTALDEIPEAAWQRKFLGSITLTLSGLGTATSPFKGTFQMNGSETVSLLYCSSPVGCDPGYSASYQLDRGIVSGSSGLVMGQGIGTVTGTMVEGTFTDELLIEFSGGPITGNTVTGVLKLAGEPAGTVTLTKK